MLPEDEIKFMSFLIEDKKLLETYNKVWDKVSNIMQKWFGSEHYMIK